MYVLVARFKLGRSPYTHNPKGRETGVCVFLDNLTEAKELAKNYASMDAYEMPAIFEYIDRRKEHIDQYGDRTA